MSAVDPTLFIRDEAGTRARAEALMLDRLVETLRPASPRLASFRSYLATTVGTMLSLVPAVLDLVGSDVASALQRIRPGYIWRIGSVLFLFLEANPNGQRAWIEQRTGAPVTSVIVDALSSGAAGRTGIASPTGSSRT